MLALAGVGARPAADVLDVPLLASPCAPLGSSPADDMATSGVDSECELTDARPLSRSLTVPAGCAPFVRILRVVHCPLDGSMTAAALLTALRGVARLCGVSNAQSCHVAFAARLAVQPALPAFPRQMPARALAALRACARSGGALPCRGPPPAPLKRRRCGGSVVACVQVVDRDEAIWRRARRAQAVTASLCCDDAPEGAVGAPAGAVRAPAGAAGAPACAEAASAGAVVASAGAVDSPTGAAAAPLGAVGAPWGAEDVSGRMVRRWVAVGGVVPSGVGGGQVVASGLRRGSLVGVRSVRVVDAGESAAAWESGRDLPLSGVAADASGGGPSSDGWRRTCVCGIWLGVAEWDLQAGVCACGRRLFYKRARDGPPRSLDVQLVPRVPRPMPDGYGQIHNPFTLLLFTLHNAAPACAYKHACLQCWMCSFELVRPRK